MFPPFSRLRALLLAALLCACAGLPAQAADMIGLPEPLPLPPPPDEPVEWGENWYLRGDVAWQQVQVPALVGGFASRFNNIDLISGGIGGGYQFNDWLRADVTIDRSIFRRNLLLDPNVWCPYQMVQGFDPITKLPVGILANPSDTCSQRANASLNRTSGLFNVYFDLIHLWGLTPYVGAGVGLTYFSGSTGVGYYRNSDGGVWAPDLTLPDGQVAQWIYPNGAPYPIQLPFAPTNWNTWQSRNNWQLAWNVMAGVSYDVARNLKVDIGYRYLNAGRYTGVPLLGANSAPAVSRDVTSHELRVGVRITAN